MESLLHNQAGWNISRERRSVQVLLVLHEEREAESLLGEFERAGFPLDGSRVSHPRAYISSLEQGRWDAIISDRILPRFSALAALEILRRRSLDLPFIVLTDDSSAETSIDLVAAGAWACVPKGDRRQLSSVLEGALARTALKGDPSRAQVALQAAEEIYRALVEASPDAITVTDLSGKITQVSGRCLEIHGCSDPSEMIGKNAFDFISPEHHARAADNLRLTLERGAVRNVTYRMLRLDGSSFDGELNASLIRDAGGHPRAFVAIVRDVTARLQVEKRVRDLAKFPDESPSPVLRITSDGSISYANPASYVMLEQWNTDVGGALPPMILDQISKTLESGEREIEKVRCRDRIFWFVLAPMEGGRYINIYAFDVTRQRQLEEQLRHVQKMEAIGTLAGGIAHDFNNLLTGILGYADLLKQETDLDELQQEAADAIEKAANRAAGLTRQLIGFARKGKLQHAAVDIERVICEVTTILSRTIDKRIHITTRFEADPPYVAGDPGQLQQVVMNLTLNARDAMPDGGEMTLETSCVTLDGDDTQTLMKAEPGRYVRLAVTDTGRGIPSDVQDRVFEPFFTTKDHGHGLGMGLATVYGIVAHHGGTVEVSSEVGVGSTFAVYLPLSEESPPSEKSASPASTPKASGHILVVDDEETVRDVVYRLLRSAGYDVVTVPDAEKAIDYYGRHRSLVDLIILDMTMPFMNGRDCFRMLRRMDPEVKVLLSTGHAAGETAQDLLNEGVLGLIQKPFGKERLLDSVEHALCLNVY